MAGTTVDGLLQAGVALAGAALVLVVMRRMPRLALALWLLVICAVPVWVAVHAKVTFEAHVVITLALLAAVVPVAGAHAGAAWARPLVPRLSVSDLSMALFFLVALVPLAFGRLRLADAFALLLQWLPAYLAGRWVARRLSLPWIYAAVAVAFTVVAGVTVVEYLTSWNPFLLISGDPEVYRTWASIQVRGGEARAQGAFGHPIALGASLAMAVPVTLAAPFRPGVRVPMAMLQVLATALTFSRAGLVAAVLGVVLTVLLPRTSLSTGTRLALGGGLLAVAAAIVPWISGVFTAAGTEAAGSAGYRWRLLQLVPGMSPFGLSPDAWLTADGQRRFGSFRSIDSTVILLGLTHGWIPMLLLVGLLLVAIGLLLSGRVSPPMIALVAQMPAIFSVALITQYGTLVWFVAGLAVSTLSAPAPSASRPEKTPPTLWEEVSPERSNGSLRR